MPPVLPVAAEDRVAVPGGAPIDVDVKQKFQFGGLALYGYEIDMLVTPGPASPPGLLFEPVLDYEQVLVTGPAHPGSRRLGIRAAGRRNVDHLPGAAGPARHLHPLPDTAGIAPRRHKPIETTDIMP